MRFQTLMLTLVVVLSLGLCLPAAAQMNIPFFSHDLPGIGLPGTAVNAAPDEADIFMSDIPMCLSGWQPGNNFLFFDNIMDLGLMQGDNIDAYSLMHDEYLYEQYPFWRFSVDANTPGMPGTAVNQEFQYNTADIFWADCMMGGWNFLCLWDWNLGLDCRDDLDALDDREPQPDFEWVYFSLTPGSPTLAAIGATPDDILGVLPRSGMMPVIVVPHWQIGLTGEDNLDALTVVGMTADQQILCVYFSVTQNANGVAGSAVNMKFPLNGADIFWSPLDNNNYMAWPAPQLGLHDHEELDAIDPDEDSTGGPPIKPGTVSASYICTPNVGTVPFVTNMSVTLSNLYPLFTRRISAHIDVTVANGSYYPNWRTGFTNIAGGGNYSTAWAQTIPGLGAVIGNNTFQLFAQDVTPAPYNQCPYPPAGDTATSTCVIVANSP